MNCAVVFVSFIFSRLSLFYLFQVHVRVLERLFKRGELVERAGVAGNLFGSGYRPTRIGASNGLRELEQVEMYSFTPSVNILGRREWRTLLTRTGDALLTYMFGWCTILLPLQNRCYLQVTGVPIRANLSKADRFILPPFSATRRAKSSSSTKQSSSTTTTSTTNNNNTALKRKIDDTDIDDNNNNNIIDKRRRRKRRRNTANVADGKPATSQHQTSNNQNNRVGRLSAWRRKRLKRQLASSAAAADTVAAAAAAVDDKQQQNTTTTTTKTTTKKRFFTTTTRKLASTVVESSAPVESTTATATATSTTTTTSIQTTSIKPTNDNEELRRLLSTALPRTQIYYNSGALRHAGRSRFHPQRKHHISFTCIRL